MQNLPKLFAEHLKSLNLSPATVYNYLSDLRRFFGWFQQKYKRRFEPDQAISKYINRYQKEVANGDIPPNTVTRYLTSLNRYAQWLQENGHINQVVVVDGVSMAKSLKKFAPTILITLSSIIIMLGSTAAALNYFGKNPVLSVFKNRVLKPSQNPVLKSIKNRVLVGVPSAGEVGSVLADISTDDYLEFNTDVRLT